MLAGIVKITICLIAAVKGVCHLFRIEDIRRMIVPVGLIALALAAILYKSVIELLKFVDYYWIYAFPFQGNHSIGDLVYGGTQKKEKAPRDAGAEPRAFDQCGSGRAGVRLTGIHSIGYNPLTLDGGRKTRPVENGRTRGFAELNFV